VSELSEPAGMSAIMVLAGLGIPVMAAMNSGLGARLGSPVLAVAILFGMALAATIVVLLLQPVIHAVTSPATPPYLYLGGLIVAFYVLSITWIAPKIGVGNAIFLVLLGQLAAAAIIDHFGLFGAPRSELSPRRMLGLALMAIGVLLACRPSG